MKTLTQLYNEEVEDGCALNSMQWYTYYVNAFNRYHGNTDLNAYVPTLNLAEFIRLDV